MWPWSTISRLKSKVRELEDHLLRLADKSGRLTTENEFLRQRWTALNESYEMAVKAGAKQTATIELQEAQLRSMNALVKNLLADLAEAQKNDARDPKTGRFVKSVGGVSSGELGQ